LCLSQAKRPEGFYADRVDDCHRHHRYSGGHCNPAVYCIQNKGYNTSARSAIKNAYIASQAFFSDSPGGTIDAAGLSAYGYRQELTVTLTVTTGTMSGLSMSSSNSGGGSTFTVDNVGAITP